MGIDEIGKLVALFISALTLLNGIYDFIKKSKKQKRLWGSHAELVMKISWITFFFLSGYFISKHFEYKFKQPLIEKLIQEKNQTHKLKAELNTSFQSILERSKSKIHELDIAVQNLQESYNEINEEISKKNGNLFGVILYSEPNYQGRPLFFKNGEYSSLHNFGFGDKVRSIKILDQLQVTLWEDVYYQGYRKRLIASAPVLSEELDNKISSMTIERMP